MLQNILSISYQIFFHILHISTKAEDQQGEPVTVQVAQNVPTRLYNLKITKKNIFKLVLFFFLRGVIKGCKTIITASSTVIVK